MGVSKVPPPGATRDEIIGVRIKTLVRVIGSEDKTRWRIHVTCTTDCYEFGASISEELALKNKRYGGEPFVNGGKADGQDEVSIANDKVNGSDYKVNGGKADDQDVVSTANDTVNTSDYSGKADDQDEVSTANDTVNSCNYKDETKDDPIDGKEEPIVLEREGGEKVNITNENSQVHKAVAEVPEENIGRILLPAAAAPPPPKSNKCRSKRKNVGEMRKKTASKNVESWSCPYCLRGSGFYAHHQHFLR
ncbi:hypothetical protein ACH5RR_018755 [Cinchona calisaya]|uniref:MORF/ORRM1/DAG-like MORF domain-containing protein n=1 Tax=Cinchona calisaya TaxID=153742 RepID=A0ABD2ZMI4_9GENT